MYGVTSSWYGNANTLCDNHPSDVHKTSSPIPGDLVVLNLSSYGHVAVIMSLDSSTVHVLEQNSSATGKNSYARDSKVLCYLHAEVL